MNARVQQIRTLFQTLFSKRDATEATIDRPAAPSSEPVHEPTVRSGPNMMKQTTEATDAHDIELLWC